MPWLLLLIPIASTLIGGALALQFRRYVSLLLAIGAGILLGAAFLDLLPEALAAGGAAGLSVTDVLALTLLSFLLFTALEDGVHALGRRNKPHPPSRFWVRRTAASMLIFHSFRDGMAIGAAYAASHGAGYAVAIGIAAHDMGDGMNTVLLTSGDGQSRHSTYLFLLADAVAPFAGGLLTVWWALSPRGSVSLLVLAAGFFLQVATGSFLPEMRRGPEPRRYLLAYVLLGAAMIYAANRLFGTAL